MMDPTPKEIMSGKNSNLAWALDKLVPPHNNKHPNNNLHSSRK